MVKCGPAGMRACSLGLVGLGFRVRDKVRVSVRDRVGVRVSDGVRVSTFYFSSASNPQNPASPHDRILPIAVRRRCNLTARLHCIIFHRISSV